MDNLNCSLLNSGVYSDPNSNQAWRMNPDGTAETDARLSSSISNFFYQPPETMQANSSSGFYSTGDMVNCGAGFPDMNNYYSRLANGFQQSFDIIPQNPSSFVRLSSSGGNGFGDGAAEQVSYMNPAAISGSFQRGYGGGYSGTSVCPPNVNIGSTSLLTNGSSFLGGGGSGYPIMMAHGGGDVEYESRELEAFAEWFKQRRIKLGVTQADVGRALGNLKLAGVGSLSQSTICRFESLTLSHNNMIALKPILQVQHPHIIVLDAAWLEDAENEAKEKMKICDGYSDIDDRKRKRTSITDAEKRSLEAFFTIQPRPSSEKIIQIAEKLNLKKNVVRVWFCNQRQKQKRMKFSTLGFQCTSSAM